MSTVLLPSAVVKKPGLLVARAQGALLLFGDEASFPQWGTLSYTWALREVQPLVPTSGKRKGYKVLGLLDYFSGCLFYQGQAGRLDTAAYLAFLTRVLAQTSQPIDRADSRRRALPHEPSGASFFLRNRRRA